MDYELMPLETKALRSGRLELNFDAQQAARLMAKASAIDSGFKTRIWRLLDRRQRLDHKSGEKTRYRPSIFARTGETRF
jgi:hypothetical protein